MAQEVVWLAKAAKQLEQAYDYILQDSLQNAEKVRKDILDPTRKILNHPEIHPPDKYRKNNDGSFRAYKLHGYTIAYQVTQERIIIVRVLHTKMEPKQY